MSKVIKKAVRIARKVCTSVNPRLANQMMYFALMKKKLNLKDPQTFNEKINYLKLNVFPKDALVVQCTDKVAVADYVRSKVGPEILVERYGTWVCPEDIPWDELPNSFALKCNHGCGYNIICSDKQSLDQKKIVKQLKLWLREDFWKTTCEPHYRGIPKRILCEKYLGNEICDYKFFCFDGNPLYFYVSRTTQGDFHNGEFAMFDINGEYAPFQRSDHKMFELKPELPTCLPEMIEISRKLSEDFPFVRVDLFEIDGEIMFSELTFTPCSGMMPLSPEKADLELGKMLDLSKYFK